MSGRGNPIILIVEDDPGVTLLERRQLERAGYAALTAINAAEALEQLRHTAIDLVLLDYRLPGEADGLELFLQIKAAGFDVPVILVTAKTHDDDVLSGYQYGADYYKVRPRDRALERFPPRTILFVEMRQRFCVFFCLSLFRHDLRLTDC